MPEMLRQTSYDTVCHEHLEYYGLSQIQWIVDKAGLKILDVEFNATNGGSFSVVTGLKNCSHPVKDKKIRAILDAESDLQTLTPYQNFAFDVAQSKKYLRDTLKKIKSDGKTVYGIGASTKGNVILQYCDITTTLLPRIGEVNPDKFLQFTPGSLIPISSEDEILNLNPDYVLILPWHFHRFFENSAKFNSTQLLYPLKLS